jgi:signal transduction histidine kinase
MTTARIATAEPARNQAPPPEADHLGGEVFSVICHDLRDPLSSIVMGAQLLLSTAPDERSRRILEAISRAGDRIGLLIRNAATLRAPQVELRTRSHRALQLLNGACDRLEKSAARRSIRLERRFAVPEDATVVCDGPRIEETMLLMGDNAVRHAEGKPVVVGAKVDRKTLTISVTDAGPGIPKERIPTIFDWVFNVTLPSREGTGLGLAASKRIVEAHGGTIGGKPKVGQGSTFFVAVPLEARHSSDAERDRISEERVNARRSDR